MSTSIESTGMGVNSNYMNFVLYGLPLYGYFIYLDYYEDS